MFTLRTNRIRAAAKALAILLALAGIISARATDGTTEAGATITNRAEATYSDNSGAIYNIVSETVTVTVLPVATLAVTPDETAATETVGPREQVTRVFRVCNTGNTPHTFSLTRFQLTAPATLVALYFDTDGSGTVTDGDVSIQLNDTNSPQLAPHGCIGVLAVIDTNDVPAQSTLTITLTARSNLDGANGRSEDSGTIINGVGTGARLTDIANVNLPPSKLINGLSEAVVDGAASFGYSINFRNSGDVPARNVVVSDQLPAGIEYVPRSLQLNDQNLP